MKMKLFVLLGISLLSFESCQKYDHQIIDNRVKNIDYVFERDDEVEISITEYYYNDSLVEILEIDTTQDQWIHYQIVMENDSLPVLQIRKYSNRVLYEAHGDSVGIDLRGQLKISDILRMVADSADLGSNTYTIPDWYQAFSDSLIISYTLNNNQNTNNLIIGTQLSDTPNNCVTWGASIVIPGVAVTLPVMPPTWNNRVSGVGFLGVGGILHIYDHIFFGKYLGAVSGWGFSKIPLCRTAANRRMSSAIRYGL